MISITVHNCTAVLAVHSEGERCNWVDLTFIDHRGREFEIAVFFQDVVVGRAFADSVNAVSK